MRLLLPLVALLGLAIAVDPVVQLKYGAYKGVRLENGLTQWLGIRYAAAPVGVLRFAAPQDPPFLEGVQLADKVSPEISLRLDFLPVLSRKITDQDFSMA